MIFDSKFKALQVIECNVCKMESPLNFNMKLNTDCSIDATTGLSIVGGGQRNRLGDWVLGFRSTTYSTKVLEAEDEALCLDFKLEHDYQLFTMKIHVYSLQLVHYLKDDAFCQNTPILFDCRCLLLAVHNPRFSMCTNNKLHEQML